MFTERGAKRGRDALLRDGSSPAPGRLFHRSGGFTLIEMIVILVVVSVVAVALFGVVSSSMVRSVDPMIRMQAMAVAQGYLEEALLQPYQDPDEAETGCEEGSTPGDRQNYDDVQDYDCISDAAPADQFGNPLPLSGYEVDVSVGGATLNGLAMQRVDVTVSHSALAVAVTLTGYRGNY